MLIQDRIKEHPDFDRWFVEYPEDTTWMEANLFDGDASEHRSEKNISPWCPASVHLLCDTSPPHQLF